MATFCQTLYTDKLERLVHYICARTEADDLGATKLNKTLWYSDATAFIMQGESITGETYIKRQFGPVPQHILPVLDSLQTKGALVVRDAQYITYPKREFIALTEPDLSVFTPQEISLVDRVIGFVCRENTAQSISKLSHDRIWELAEIGEEIPLYAILASQKGEIDEHDILWAKQQIGMAD